MKKLLALILCLACLCSGAFATISPATGVDVNFYGFTGIECIPAVVLCESLTILDNRGDQGGQKAGELLYSGQTIPVIESWDGYAKIYYDDGNKTGWVRNEYLMLDPAWYLCDGETQVYAYPAFMAPRVALLEEGTILPILTQAEVENQGWVCVSLRGAAGWIRKTPRDTVDETWFRPEMLADLAGASLSLNGADYPLTDPEGLAELAKLLTSVSDLGGPMAGCPFGALLTLTCSDGRIIPLDLATDSCCAYRVDGRDYQYARFLKTPDSGVDNTVLYSLFGVAPY